MIKYFEEPARPDFSLYNIDFREELDYALTTEISKEQARGRNCLKVYYYEESDEILYVKRFNSNDFPIEELYTEFLDLDDDEPFFGDEEDEEEDGYEEEKEFHWESTVSYRYKEFLNSGNLSSLVIEIAPFAESSLLSEENKMYYMADIGKIVCDFKDGNVIVRYFDRENSLHSQATYAKSKLQDTPGPISINSPEEICEEVLEDMGFSLLKKESYDMNGDAASKIIYHYNEKGELTKIEYYKSGIWHDLLSSFQTYDYDSKGRMVRGMYHRRVEDGESVSYSLIALYTYMYSPANSNFCTTILCEDVQPENSWKTSLTYDKKGQLVKLEKRDMNKNYKLHYIEEYQYNKDGRNSTILLRGIKSDADSLKTYSYDEKGRVISYAYL